MFAGHPPAEVQCWLWSDQGTEHRGEDQFSQRESAPIKLCEGEQQKRITLTKFLLQKSKTHTKNLHSLSKNQGWVNVKILLLPGLRCQSVILSTSAVPWVWWIIVTEATHSRLRRPEIMLKLSTREFKAILRAGLFNTWECFIMIRISQALCAMESSIQNILILVLLPFLKSKYYKW